jgi:pimeloyl-ACP methyl ester carboxylesterase
VTLEGWAKWNRHYFLRDWPGFLEFFFTQTFTEPHSTKQTEDAIGWGLQTDPQAIVRGMDAEWTNDRDSVLRLAAQVRCPTLVIQGSQDAVVGPAGGPRGCRGRCHPRCAADHTPGLPPRAAPARPGQDEPPHPGLRIPDGTAAPGGAISRIVSALYVSLTIGRNGYGSTRRAS